MNERIKILKQFANRYGWDIDKATNGLNGGMIYYRHILRNYELVVEWERKDYTVYLHNDTFMPNETKEIIKQLVFMDYLANYTYDMLEEFVCQGKI